MHFLSFRLTRIISFTHFHLVNCIILFLSFLLSILLWIVHPKFYLLILHFFRVFIQLLLTYLSFDHLIFYMIFKKYMFWCSFSSIGHSFIYSSESFTPFFNYFSSYILRFPILTFVIVSTLPLIHSLPLSILSTAFHLSFIIYWICFSCQVFIDIFFICFIHNLLQCCLPFIQYFFIPPYFLYSRPTSMFFFPFIQHVFIPIFFLIN